MEAPPTLSPDHGLYAGAGSPNISQPEGTGRPQAIARPSHAHSSWLWLLSFGPVASPWPEVWQEGAGRGPRGCSCFCKGADLDLIQRHPLPLPQVAGLGSPPHHPSFTGSIHLGLACKCISPVGTLHGVTPALLPQTPCREGPDGSGHSRSKVAESLKGRWRARTAPPSRLSQDTGLVQGTEWDREGVPLGEQTPPTPHPSVLRHAPVRAFGPHAWTHL